MLDTYILKIDKNLEKETFDKLLNYVSEEKKTRIYRYHEFEDAQRTLLGDVLIRYIICKRLSVGNKDLIFKTNEFGKPILHEPKGIFFSISHSGSWVVCAVDDNVVGVDVETIKPIDFRIAERYFSRDEYISLLKQPEKMKLTYFYMIWTLKESYIKTEGKGLSIPLNSFSIRIEGNDISIITCNNTKKYYFYQSLLSNNAVYAICYINNNARENVYWNIRNISQVATNMVDEL